MKFTDLVITDIHFKRVLGPGRVLKSVAKFIARSSSYYLEFTSDGDHAGLTRLLGTHIYEIPDIAAQKTSEIHEIRGERGTFFVSSLRCTSYFQLESISVSAAAAQFVVSDTRNDRRLTLRTAAPDYKKLATFIATPLEEIFVHYDSLNETLYLNETSVKKCLVIIKENY